MFITTAMFVGLPEHHRQPGQYRVTCRTPEVCSGWDKGDIPPVEANREECQIIWKGNTPEKAWKEELYMLRKTMSHQITTGSIKERFFKLIFLSPEKVKNNDITENK